MCWLCDHPEATWDDYLDQVLHVVANSGFCVQQVGGNRLRCGYSYTVGLSELEEPELLVTGMSATRGYQLVRDMAHHVLHDTAPPAGEVVPLREGPVVQFVRVDVPEVHLPVANELYGPALRALQMVWRDDHGKWPWEVGHRAGRGGQPVLGTPLIA
jgi:hypothetical protein